MTPPKELLRALNRLASKALEVQGNVLSWTLKTEEDFDALERDLEDLIGYVEDAHQEAVNLKATV